MERDKEQTEGAAKAETKFSRLKQQARARINELSKEIDTLKLGQEADGKTSLSQEVTTYKIQTQITVILVITY